MLGGKQVPKGYGVNKPPLGGWGVNKSVGKLTPGGKTTWNNYSSITLKFFNRPFLNSAFLFSMN